VRVDSQVTVAAQDAARPTPVRQGDPAASSLATRATIPFDRSHTPALTLAALAAVQCTAGNGAAAVMVARQHAPARVWGDRVIDLRQQLAPASYEFARRTGGLIGEALGVPVA
jgi:hypothetical protein